VKHHIRKIRLKKDQGKYVDRESNRSVSLVSPLKWSYNLNKPRPLRRKPCYNVTSVSTSK